MTDVDPSKALINSNKKSSRKSKAPVYRGLATPPSTSNGRLSRDSPLTESDASPVPAVTTAMLTMKKPEAIMANPNQQQQQPIKSYSDFMRSLAAKYNNNE